jgi:hypothetical protein
MEEVLYNIEIHRNEANYMGKLFSDIDGMKEFENDRIDRLLRDMIVDMQLAFDEFSNRSADFGEGIEEIK